MMPTDDDSKPAVDAIPDAKRPRRPYRAPQLRRLGSVREVTWGPGSALEGAAVGSKLAKM